MIGYLYILEQDAFVRTANGCIPVCKGSIKAIGNLHDVNVECQLNKNHEVIILKQVR